MNYDFVSSADYILQNNKRFIFVEFTTWFSIGDGKMNVKCCVNSISVALKEWRIEKNCSFEI